MRIALGVEYDGSGFVGWQTQKDGNSVQQAVERALSQVANHPIAVTCAGRTDAGVHAWGQVIHFDTNAQRDSRAWVLGANTNLPNDIAITWAKEVGEGFHARFSALSRTYRYVVLTRGARSPIHRDHATWRYRPLDVDAMQEAANGLLGEHDFSAFRAASCQSKSAHRRIFTLKVLASSDGLVMDITANAFLQHMVRNIAGVLMKIGAGEASPQWCAEVLASKDRRQGGVTAPAEGLYFVSVKYPEQFDLPKGRAVNLVP